MEQEARTATTERKLALEQEKQPHRDRLTQTLEQIAATEETSKRETSALQGERKRGLDDALEPLLEQRGTWEARKSSPAASDGDSIQVSGDHPPAIPNHLARIPGLPR